MTVANVAKVSASPVQAQPGRPAAAGQLPGSAPQMLEIDLFPGAYPLGPVALHVPKPGVQLQWRQAPVVSAPSTKSSWGQASLGAAALAALAGAAGGHLTDVPAYAAAAATLGAVGLGVQLARGLWPEAAANAADATATAAEKPTEALAQVVEASQPLQLSAAGLQLGVQQLWQLPGGVVHAGGAHPLLRSLLTLMQAPHLGLVPPDLKAQLGAAVAAASAPAPYVDAAASAGAAAAADAAARQAFNVLLDRTQLAGTLALHAGSHTVAGLGLEAGLPQGSQLQLRVQPGTVVQLHADAIDQQAGTVAEQSSLFARLGAALGALWRRLVAALTASPAAKPVAPPAQPSRTTMPDAKLYAHNLTFAANKRLVAHLDNWSRHLLQVSVRGATVDEAGALALQGSVRLLGVPVLSLGAGWVRRALTAAGVVLTLDPYRLLWQGEVFAADAQAPSADAQAPSADVPALSGDAQAARAASSLALLGAVLGPVKLTLTPYATEQPRLQHRLQRPGQPDVTTQLFAAPAPFAVTYDLGKFATPLALGLDGLHLRATLQAQGADAVHHVELGVGGLHAEGFWPDPLGATVWRDVALRDVQLGVGATAVDAGRAATVRLQQAGVTRTLQGARVYAALRREGAAAPAAALLGLLQPSLDHAEAHVAVALLQGLRVDLPWQQGALAEDFVPGPVQPRPATARADAPGASVVAVVDAG